MSGGYRIECPACGERGRTNGMGEGVECPTCGQKFVPPRPSFWERQKANSVLVQAPWVIGPVLAAILFVTGTISIWTVLTLTLLGLLGAIAFWLSVIAKKKN